jgi:recombinational DNA repair protein (RecF pathway)
MEEQNMSEYVKDSCGHVVDLSTCVRCGSKHGATTMSRFNEDIICMACLEKERAHPQYPAAAKAELEACQRGDYNFPGIGKPGDL